MEPGSLGVALPGAAWAAVPVPHGGVSVPVAVVAVSPSGALVPGWVAEPGPSPPDAESGAAESGVAVPVPVPAGPVPAARAAFPGR